MSKVLLLVLITLAMVVLGVLVVGLWSVFLGLKQTMVASALVTGLGLAVLSTIAFVGALVMYIKLVIDICGR